MVTKIGLPSNLSMAILMVMGSDLAWAALVGGRLCLDFANTLGGTRAEGSTERLTDYGTFVDWAVHAGAVDAAHARKLRQKAAAHPRAAADALAAARTLREALFRLFHAVIDEVAPDEDDVALLEAHLRRAVAAPRLLRDGARFSFAFAVDDALTAPLDPIARSAAELLASDELPRVRMCSSDGCDWLFVDRTRSHTRRWCEMKACGNRAKARRYYARQKNDA